ncbi:MAG: TlpA family protein disulfide reductase [Oscillospiraceae bacterium]|nr:TlpA family protein disulfide reductase [Oscillospiraceae bacterium]
MKKTIAVLLALLMLGLAACAQSAPKQAETASAETQTSDAQKAETAESDDPAAPDFTLTDQFGKEHRLSDYKGKVVLLNFWATWCKYCVQEMPDLQKLHEKYSAQEDPQLVLLAVAAPGQGGEQDAEGIKAYLETNGYTYPSLMDTDGSVFKTYGASALPTTFVIGRDGSVIGYVPGAMTEEMLEKVVAQALNTDTAKEEKQ